jgi:murein DD-endopeptidase MepM/ murein hydrolase activator NlpD
VKVGQEVVAGDILGVVTRVLKVDKGRPMSMLHLELRVSGNTADIEWLDPDAQPEGLLDPTPLLLTCAR